MEFGPSCEQADMTMESSGGGGVEDNDCDEEEGGLGPDLLKKVEEKYLPVKRPKLYSFKTISFGDVAVDMYCLHHVVSWENVELGEAVWPSARILSRYLVENPDAVRDGTVLELGCGPGLTGLVAAKLNSRPGGVVLTDNCQLVLDRLVPSSIQRSFPHPPDQPRCDYLHWGSDLPQFHQRYGSFDVILGADIIYWTEYVEPLIQTVSALLSSKPSSYFITIYEKRFIKAPDTTIPILLDMAHKYNLACVQIPLENNQEYQEARKKDKLSNFELYKFMWES